MLVPQVAATSVGRTVTLPVSAPTLKVAAAALVTERAKEVHPGREVSSSLLCVDQVILTLHELVEPLYKYCNLSKYRSL